METLTLEKRAYSRRDCSLPIQHREVGKAGATAVKTVAVNIGAGGVAFRSSGFMPLAHRIVMEIALPGALESVKAITRVTRIRKIPASGRYEIGSQFLEISKEDKARVLDFTNP